MASLAVNTITNHTEELIMMFSSDPELIARILFSTNFIQDDVLLKMSSDNTPTGKAAILVEAVKKKIELSPEKIMEFIDIISENDKDVMDSLLSTYQNFQQSLSDSLKPPCYTADDDQPGQLIPQCHAYAHVHGSEDSPGSTQALSLPTERVLTEKDIATLLNLMHNFSDKWNEIGLGLGFVPSELRQISSNLSLLMYPASFLATLLEQWVQWPTKEHPTKPTLEALCEAMRGSLAGLGSLAEQVERELIQKCSSTEMLQAPSTAIQSSNCPQSPGKSARSVDMIRTNVEKIKALFSSLLVKVQSSLQSQSDNISNVRDFLITFFKCDFPETSNIKKLFATITLNDLWDYHHYSPLVHLIDQFLPSDQEVESLMKAYKACLSGFYLTTKLIDYIKYQNLSANDSDEECDQPYPKLTPKQYKKIKVVLQLERKISQVSLDYVVKLWQSFAEEYEMPSLTAVIDRIVAGSLEVTWIVPQHIANAILPRAKFFQSHGIVLVSIDDVIIYDEKQMAAKEKRFFNLCYDGTAAIRDFSSLLAQGVDPDIYDQHGRHPLGYVSYHGRQDLVEFFLKYRADIDIATKDDFGETALVTAVSEGHLHVAEILVKNGADVNYRNKKGKSVLWHASFKGHTEIVLLLLHHHAAVDLPNDNERGATALFAACQEGCYDPAALLINHGADVNYLSKTGGTPMYFAAQYNHPRLVKLLLAHGADINKGVQSPLYASCHEGNIEMVQLLVHHHAAIDQPTNSEYAATPLITASGENHIEVARFLVEHGASVNYQTKYGDSSVQAACDSGNTNIVKLLIQSNANIELKNNAGRTGLMLAAWRGHSSIVAELVRAGAQIDAQDQNGLTAYDIASSESHTAVCQLLEQYGYKPIHVVPAPLQSSSHHHYDPVTSLQTIRDIVEHGSELSDTPTKHQKSHTALESEHSYDETDHGY